MTPAAAIARRCLLPAIERPEPAPPRRRAGKFRPCVINGVRYRSLSDAGRATGLHPVSVAHRCASSQWPGWVAEGIDVVERAPRGRTMRPVWVGNVRFESVTAAGLVMGVTKSAVCDRIRRGLNGWRYE